MLANGTGKALVKSGGDSWFFLTADYAFGHALERDTAAVVVANGGKVLGGVKHPLNNADFSSFLLQAQSSKAKIIGLANAGGDTTNSIKQAAEFGIVAGGQKLAGMLMFITDVHSLGLKVAQGLNFTETFYWDMNDQTRAFTKRFNEKYKKNPPTMVQAGVYSSLIHYFKALEALGGNPHDGRAVVAKMKELPTDDPLFGKGSVRADGRKIHPAYLFEVKKPADSKYPWDYYNLVATIPADGSLHPARKERLPDAEEDLSIAISDNVTRPSPAPGEGFCMPRKQKISKTTPCTVEMGLNSQHFSPPCDRHEMLSRRGRNRSEHCSRSGTLRTTQSKPTVAGAAIPAAMLEIGGNEILRSSVSTSSCRQLENSSRASNPPPSRLASVSVPRSALTSCWAMARPSPVPPVSRLREASTR